MFIPINEKKDVQEKAKTSTEISFEEQEASIIEALYSVLGEVNTKLLPEVGIALFTDYVSGHNTVSINRNGNRKPEANKPYLVAFASIASVGGDAELCCLYFSIKTFSEKGMDTRSLPVEGVDNIYLRHIAKESVTAENIKTLLPEIIETQLAGKLADISKQVNNFTRYCQEIDENANKLQKVVINSRSDYEAACKEFGIAALTDDDILKKKYAMEFGEFYRSEYSIADFSRAILDQKYYTSTLKQEANKEAAQEQATQSPRKTGQLWEPCEQCGQEPSYMPLHLCDSCWPE